MRWVAAARLSISEIDLSVRWPVCSISSELQAIAMEEGFDDLDAPVLRVTDVDVPLPYAANLEKLALVKSEDVVAAAKKVCYR